MHNVLFIDNFDSFSYNLVEALEQLDCQVTVVRNQVATETLLELTQSHDFVVISPGPGAPDSAGNCLSFLQRIRGRMPVLGICLGHQLIAQSYGGEVIRAELPVHGKTSYVEHNNYACFAELPNPFPVARYHSLVVNIEQTELQEIASFNGITMAIYHAQDQMLGFQFHPESILTTNGGRLLQQSVELLFRSSSQG